MGAAHPRSTASYQGQRALRRFFSTATTTSSPPVTWLRGSGQQASVNSGNYGNIVPNPVLPLARLIADIEERVRAWSAEHEAFRREASEVFAKWEDKAVWTPFLKPTVNINSFMSDGASLTL